MGTEGKRRSISDLTPIHESETDDELQGDRQQQDSQVQTISCGTPDATTNLLYTQVRRNLNKVNRVSKSTLPTPKTPSKSGVVVESSIGKFNDIKARFDRRLLDNAVAGSKMLTGNRFTSKIVSRITGIRVKPRPVSPLNYEESNPSPPESKGDPSNENELLI